MSIAAPGTVPEVVYEEANFFIVNKPPGYYSHPNHLGHQVNSLVGYFADKMDFPELPEKNDKNENMEDEVGNAHSAFLQLRKGLVHRLDRETSGLVIMAKNPLSLEVLKALFKERRVKKKYQALVHGHFFEHDKLLIHKLIREPHHRTRRKVWEKSPRLEVRNHTSSNREGDGGEREKNYKVAETQVTPISFFKEMTLVDIEIFTGRTHQIRVQLSHEGFPIVGDSLYGLRQGGQKKRDPVNLFLCAYFLEFQNPFTGEGIAQEIGLPDYFTGYMSRCEKYQLTRNSRKLS